ncbi:MAG: pantoate--beta-alanine ligase [Parasphingopyxis sp.]
METVRHIGELREAVHKLREGGRKIALVPTMGALHAGHARLVEEGLKRADRVVASIFVNPRQFGQGEDFEQYPRSEEADREKLAEAGVSLLWAPAPGEVYPEGFATNVSVGGLGEGLCGGARPGHFDGVATVVAKLFNQLRPDIALFGEKDYQQLAVIRRMAADLDFDIEIVGVPTVREADGLALSSRNAYLSAAERREAVALPRALRAGAEALRNGIEPGEALADVEAALFKGGFDMIDYVELRDAETLEPLETLDRPARLLAAARIGTTRLIDNVAVEPI